MTFEEKIKNSTTGVFKAVFPETINHYDTLYGGTVIYSMDENEKSNFLLERRKRFRFGIV